MKTEVRTIVYDNYLQIEAYTFENIMQPFPNHFHDYYVIGCAEHGERLLICRNKEYTLRAGDLIIFNPGDNHRCRQSDEDVFNYNAINISKSVMCDMVEDITGEKWMPEFSCSVINDDDLKYNFAALHKLIMSRSHEFSKSEYMLMVLDGLIRKYAQPFGDSDPEYREEVEKACRYMEVHFSEHITLEQIGYEAGLSKSTLLRAFAKAKGVTPYLYLQNIRIGEAKKLLEKGAAPADTALRTGFSDQSHFTNYFMRFIGLTPSVYREIFSAGRNGDNDGNK